MVGIRKSLILKIIDNLEENISNEKVEEKK